MYFSKYVMLKSFSGPSVWQHSKDRWANGFPVDQAAQIQIFPVTNISKHKYIYLLIQIFPNTNTNISTWKYKYIKAFKALPTKPCIPPTSPGMFLWKCVKLNLAKVAQRLMEDHHLHWSSTICDKKDRLCTSRKISSLYSPRAASKLSNDTREEENEKNWLPAFLPHDPCLDHHSLAWLEILYVIWFWMFNIFLLRGCWFNPRDLSSTSLKQKVKASLVIYFRTEQTKKYFLCTHSLVYRFLILSEVKYTIWGSQKRYRPTENLESISLFKIIHCAFVWSFPLSSFCQFSKTFPFPLSLWSQSSSTWTSSEEHSKIQGAFFHWYPPKKFQVQKS